MNQVLEEIIKSGYVKSPSGNLIQVQGNITQETGEFLTEIIAELKPKVTLEVGLAYGVSALFICQELKKYPNTRHIIIDPCQNTIYGGLGLNNLRKAGYQEIIDFCEQPSQTFLPQLETLGVKIDFAFIDGWHTFDHTLVDFFYIDKLLNKGGVVAFDDSTWPSVSKVLRFIIKNRSYTVFRCLHNISLPLVRALRARPTASFKLARARFESLGPLFRNVSSFGIGINPTSTCVALKKIAEDNRRGGFHRKF